MIGKRFDEALQYAVDLHRTQKRKGTDRNAAGEPVQPTPYVAHLLGVASRVLEAGADEDEAIAALLHAAVEDHPRGGQTALEIRQRFGDRVLAIVKGCTKEEVDRTRSPQEQQAQRRAIRKRYFEEHLPSAERSLVLVTAADKLHNLRAIVADLREHGPAALDRFNDTRDGTLWYYRGVVKALRAGAPQRLAVALEEELLRFEALAGCGGSSRA